MKVYSTAQVARAVNVNKSTLLRWLYSGKLVEPKHHRNGGVDLRLWSERDLECVRKYKAKNFRKGRGRKKSA